MESDAAADDDDNDDDDLGFRKSWKSLKARQKFPNNLLAVRANASSANPFPVSCFG